MKRRAFLGVVLSSPAAVAVMAVLATALPKRHTLGLVNYNRWLLLGLQDHRLYLDGIDITNVCCEFNDEVGPTATSRIGAGGFRSMRLRPKCSAIGCSV